MSIHLLLDSCSVKSYSPHFLPRLVSPRLADHGTGKMIGEPCTHISTAEYYTRFLLDRVDAAGDLYCFDSWQVAVCGDYARLRDMQRDILRGHTPRMPMMDTAMSSSTRVRPIARRAYLTGSPHIFFIKQEPPLPIAGERRSASYSIYCCKITVPHQEKIRPCTL